MSVKLKPTGEHLLQLRRESYQAAAEYHRAVELWATVSRAQERDGVVSVTLLRYREIAASYRNALETLSAHLRTLEPSKLVTEELGRTQKIQELLEREIALTF